MPKDNVLGEVGKGYKIAIETLNEGRIGIGAQMLGLARGAWEFAVKYAQERKQFGRAIAEFQGIQFQIAQMATEIEAARMLLYNCARMKDAGMSFLKEAAMTKLYCSQVAERVASLCVEIYGGYGFTKDYPVEKFFRDSKIGKIYEGTSQHAATDHRQAGDGKVKLQTRVTSRWPESAGSAVSRLRTASRSGTCRNHSAADTALSSPSDIGRKPHCPCHLG